MNQENSYQSGRDYLLSFIGKSDIEPDNDFVQANLDRIQDIKELGEKLEWDEQ